MRTPPYLLVFCSLLLTHYLTPHCFITPSPPSSLGVACFASAATLWLVYMLVQPLITRTAFFKLYEQLSSSLEESEELEDTQVEKAPPQSLAQLIPTQSPSRHK